MALILNLQPDTSLSDVKIKKRSNELKLDWQNNEGRKEKKEPFKETMSDIYSVCKFGMIKEATVSQVSSSKLFFQPKQMKP